MVQYESNSQPLHTPRVAHAAAEAVRKAYAVGLVDRSPDFPELTYSYVQQTAARVREAGIAVRAAAALERADPPGPEEMTRLLQEIDARLEESPLPDTEWPRLLGIFDRDALGRLLNLSASSIARYAGGERRTPDAAAARLHTLAHIVGDLTGAYTEIAIRRRFDRPRTALDGRAPVQLLKGDWQPEDPGPRRVRELARSLVTSPGT
jgi:uncharacterized protein YbjT (DUF2867 family)